MTTTTTGKVRRNSKRLRRIIDTARNVRIYDSSNGYEAEPVSDLAASEILQRELDTFSRAYIRDNGAGMYTLKTGQDFIKFEADA